MADIVTEGALEFLTQDESIQLRNSLPMLVGMSKVIAGSGLTFDGDELLVKASGIELTAGDLNIDLTDTDAILTTIDLDTSLLATTVSGGKILTTETNSAGIKVSADALAALISSNKLLVTETSATGIKTSVDSLATSVNSGKLLVTETSAAATKTNTDTIKADVALIKADVATIKADIALIKANTIVKVLVDMVDGTTTGSLQTITVTGTRLEVCNNSNSGNITVGIGGKTKIIYAQDSFSVDTAQFTSFTLQGASASLLYSYTVMA